MDVEEQDDATPDGRVPDFSSVIALCLDVLAGMGTGKTYQTECFFKAHDDASILIICPRKSMCFAMTKRLEELGFQLYTSIMHAKRLVIEYESMHKLQRTYDIIYIDEIRSVLTTAVCYATNRMNATRHLDRLVDVCKQAKHTILTDADSNLDSAVSVFRESVFEPSDVHKIFVPRPFMKRTFRLVTKAAALEQMHDDLRAGHRVVACFASAKMLRGCLRDLENIIDKSLITGYFADADNKDELFDVNCFWAKYRFIGYTSTVTVSLDFTEPVHRVYMFPNRFSFVPREGLQSVGRPRNITTEQIIVAKDSDCRYMPLEREYDFNADYERELKFLTDRRASITSFNSLTEQEREQYGTFEEKLTEEGPTYTPTLYTKLWAVDRAEKALKFHDWYPHLLWIFKKKGYEVEYADLPEPSDEPESVEGEEGTGKRCGGEILTDVSIAADEIIAQEISEMNEIDATELDDEWEQVMNTRHAKDMLLHHEKLALRKYQAQKYFTGALAGQDVVFFEKHKKAIMYRILSKDATPSELFTKHKEGFERARRCGMEDIVSQDFNVRTALLKLLMDVGYGGFHDRTSEICLKEASELPGVAAGVNKVQQLVGGTTKRNSTLSGVLKPWLLKYMGLKLQARQSGKRLFREELSVDDIYTVISKRRAVMNACSMLKLSVNERAEFFLVDAHGREEYDFLRSDYLVLRHVDRLLRVLGYSGLNDRTKSVNLMVLDAKPQDQETSQDAKDGDIAQLAEDVTRKLEIVRKIRRNVRFRGKTESIVKEMKSILKTLIGIHLKGSRGPRPERVFEHKMQEIDDIWRIARMGNVFFDAKWKAAMARRVADLRKSGKRKRNKTSEVDGAQQLLAVRSDEIWEW
eukprot:g14439.t1